ncbi:MAG: acetylxylan esterase, partial [Undibacterium sp.]|nr:acetylxylan esterase [Opitutaceae bacterium]
MNLCVFLAVPLVIFAPPIPPLTAADTRADFLKLIDRPRVPLAPEIEEAPPGPDGLTRLTFTYAADATNRVPAILLKSSAAPSAVGLLSPAATDATRSPSSSGPASSNGSVASPRRPVIIVLHGTGGTKESELPFLTELAHAGFIAVAIDGRYHGARSKSGKGSADYIDAILRTFRTGREKPFFYDTVWDVMRLVDYLETRDDVDPKRIGLFGISKGGIETYLTAAVDSRIAAAVPCIAVESFRWAVENN